MRHHGGASEENTAKSWHNMIPICTPEGPVLENNWVPCVGADLSDHQNPGALTFLRRMKLAGTNFLMPKVSRKAFPPPCY